MSVYLGVDLGTQGCRAVAVRDDGSLVSSAHVMLAGRPRELPAGWSEQDAREWWPCVRATILKTTARLHEAILGICVDSTSGTVLAIDRVGNPLSPAIMYNDGRASEEARAISQAAGSLQDKLGYRVGASYAAAKLLWLRRNLPHVFESAHAFVHAADFINGKLTGDFGFTDHTNALKSCFDLIDYRWPDCLQDLGLPFDRMPQVVAPGEAIGTITPQASRDTSIPEGVDVYAGLTDGCASQIASGAAGVDEWETTLGTTLVIKGVTEGLIRDPLGRIYSHLHPERLWMPGGASNTGGECLEKCFAGVELERMDVVASGLVPTGLVAYPLVRRGERFPFIAPDAEGFVLGQPSSREQLYAAYLEGVAFTERLAYETLEGLGAKVGSHIFVAGGGARSQAWLQVRANVLSRTLLRPSVPEAAMGCAMLAASSRLNLPLRDVVRQMVRIDTRVDPQAGVASVYEGLYEEFTREVAERFGVLY